MYQALFTLVNQRQTLLLRNLKSGGDTNQAMRKCGAEQSSWRCDGSTCLILSAEARQSLLEGVLYELKLDNEALDGQSWEGKSILSMCKGLKLIDWGKEMLNKLPEVTQLLSGWARSPLSWKLVLLTARPNYSLAIPSLGPSISAYLHPVARIRMGEKEPGEGLRVQSGSELLWPQLELLQVWTGGSSFRTPTEGQRGAIYMWKSLRHVCVGGGMHAHTPLPTGLQQRSFPLPEEPSPDDPPSTHFHVTLRKEPGGMASWAKMP